MQSLASFFNFALQKFCFIFFFSQNDSLHRDECVFKIIMFFLYIFPFNAFASCSSENNTVMNAILWSELSVRESE
jgi:hypothetical protein